LSLHFFKFGSLKNNQSVEDTPTLSSHFLYHFVFPLLYLYDSITISMPSLRLPPLSNQHVTFHDYLVDTVVTKGISTDCVDLDLAARLEEDEKKASAAGCKLVKQLWANGYIESGGYPTKVDLLMTSEQTTEEDLLRYTNNYIMYGQICYDVLDNLTPVPILERKCLHCSEQMCQSTWFYDKLTRYHFKQLGAKLDTSLQRDIVLHNFWSQDPKTWNLKTEINGAPFCVVVRLCREVPSLCPICGHNPCLFLSFFDCFDAQVCYGGPLSLPVGKKRLELMRLYKRHLSRWNLVESGTLPACVKFFIQRCYPILDQDSLDTSKIERLLFREEEEEED
jgi:hypothetical protein